MGLFDALLGRTKPVPADLDALFALPTAAITLEAAGGLRPTGIGSVCVKAAEGGDFLRAYACFGPALLCSTVWFAGTVDGVPRRVALVYLYKRGAFYPFAPVGPQRRDTAFELQLLS